MVAKSCMPEAAVTGRTSYQNKLPLYKGLRATKLRLPPGGGFRASRVALLASSDSQARAAREGGLAAVGGKQGGEVELE